jgi:hypothetical protein
VPFRPGGNADERKEKAMKTRASSLRVAVAGLLVLAAASLSATAAAATPENDAFAAARALSGRTQSVTDTNVDATKELGEPDHAGEPGGASVWYAWTAPAAGRVRLSTCSSDVDTVLAVYTGEAIDSLDEVTSDDNACGEQSRVSFEASAGIEYMIAVDGVDGDTGTIALQLDLAPPNDDFAAAGGLTGNVGSVAGNSEGASIEVDEPEHYFGIGYPSVWYAWTAPSTDWATFTTCGSAFDTVIAAYVGSDLGDLSEVASNDDVADCWPGSRIVFQATAGTTYFVAVAGYDGLTGEFTLSWNRNPPPPEPPSPVTLPRVLGEAVEGTTLTAGEGEWRGDQPISFAIEWGRCDRDYERCGPIPGNAARTYAPTAADVGWRLYIRVTATNAVGSWVEFSNLTPLVAARPPQNVVVPQVTGRVRLGQILVATTGEWGGTRPMSFSYQWQSCDAAETCYDLGGEAAPVLRVTAAHLARTLRVVVTAANPGGSADATSDTTALVRRTAARRCVVPNVKRKTVAGARRAIRRAGCSVGRLQRSYSSSVGSGRVISQSPRPGARRAAGGRVNLVLSRGRRR